MSATLLGKGIEEQENDDDNNATEDDNNTNTRNIKKSTGSKLMRTLGGSSKCAIVESEGRQHPIQIQWASQVVKMMSSRNNNGGVGVGGVNRIPPLGSLLRDKKLLIETVSNVVEKAALKQAPSRGDILVFLPGVAECKGVVRELTSTSSVTNIADVFALYGAMSKEEQDRVLFYSEQEHNLRKDAKESSFRHLSLKRR